jgi:hypothetical protein
MNEPEYTIIRRVHRKTASIIISPDKTVKVVVPAFVDDVEIARLISSKRRWISKKLAELNSRQTGPCPHYYREGETFPFLGKQLRLQVKNGAGADVVLADDTITLALPLPFPDKTRQRLIRTRLCLWYNRMALQILTDKSHQLGRLCGVKPEFIGIKDYRSRWGCCFGDGRIYYNWKIIGAPESIVDYVVIHELCHLVHPNHSPKYWQLVNQCLPDWPGRRAWLRGNGHTLEI